MQMKMRTASSHHVTPEYSIRNDRVVYNILQTILSATSTPDHAYAWENYHRHGIYVEGSEN